MRITRFFALAAFLLVTLAQSGFCAGPKEEAQEEIRQAFEEAEGEIAEEASEAQKEIKETEAEALQEIDEAVSEAKREGSTREAIDEAMREMKESVKEAMSEAREAVQEIRQESKEDVAEARHEAAEAIEDCKKEACKEGKGGGGALTVQILALDTDPFIDLNEREADLKAKRFDFDKRTIAMIGGLGYYDVGGGTRVGVAGGLGYKYYVSDVFTTVDTVDTIVISADSAALLRIWPAYLGFNFEKAFIFDKITLFVGGLFGGGAYIMHKKLEDRTNLSAFVDISSDSTESSEDEYGSLGFATFMAWDLHGGISLRLAPVFEVGVEPYVLFNYAPEGFGTGFGDFFAVNPGVRIRFGFGKKA